MQIQAINTSNNINFNAQRVAKAKNVYNGLTTRIEIFQLKEKDIPFLKKLLNKISFKELFPKLSDKELKTWQDIFRMSVFNSMDTNNTSYIAFCNNNPCGLLTMQKGKTFNLIDLLAIPIDKNRKASLSGQTLLYQAFLDAQTHNAEKISLEAVKSSPGNPVEKYKELGMTSISDGERYVGMESSKQNIQAQIQNWMKMIEYKKCKPKNVDLETLSS